MGVGMRLRLQHVACIILEKKWCELRAGPRPVRARPPSMLRPSARSGRLVELVKAHREASVAALAA